MNLPFVLDVAIGLIFIYLILSLLASEIQELLATVLQWRAEHLKKSIENLLSGSSEQQLPQALQLANKLYDSPLINNINQEAKGMMANIPRQLTWMIGKLYRSMTSTRQGNQKSESIFGERKNTGPSYIPSETFASTLLETLKVSTLSHKLSISRLEEFQKERLLKEIRNILDSLVKTNEQNERLLLNTLDKEFDKLQREFNRIIEDFRSEKATLTTSIERIAEKLDRYIANSESHITKSELSIGSIDFSYQMQSLKQDIFGSTPASIQAENVVLLRQLKPTLSEIIETYRQIKTAKNENSPTYQKLKEVYGDIEDAIDVLPESLIDSLGVLAKRARSKVHSTEEDINQLRLEIEHWFDRSMERASGVYKRNAKGVAILIGIFLAWVTNADSFHIIARLAKNPSLRTVVTERASQAVTTPGGLDEVKAQVNEALNDIPIPVGRSENNLNQQEEEGRGWQINGMSFSWLRRTLGWFLTGFAISMGAPFWFDLLGKVVNVRNAGKRPASSVSYAQTSDIVKSEK